MPTYKFKTFEEAKRALWCLHPDEAYYQRVAELWDFADKLNPVRYPSGIFKFESLEQANRHREGIELAHAKKLHRKRMKKDMEGK